MTDAMQTPIDLGPSYPFQRLLGFRKVLHDTDTARFELELRGDFLDRVPALVQQRRGAVDAGIEMKPARRKTNRTSEFLPKRLV